MSLKAKIEAVIYATEEPVTLAQLATLFAPELAEARETRLAAEKAAQQASELVNPDATTEPDASADADTETDQPSVTEAESAVEPQGDEPEVQPEADPQADPEAAVEGATADVAVVSEFAVVSESTVEDEKRAARQRERDLRDEARSLIESLIADYDASERGMEIREIAGGYRIATRAEYHDAVRAFVKSLKPPMKLSLQALETLAVIAYKQPVTAPEVSDIRGVDSAGVLGSLISRKLVTTAGRKQVIGRPILYKTTKEFLLRFGLKDLNELPSMEEFEKMAGELSDAEQMPLTEVGESTEEVLPVEGVVPEEIPEQEPATIAITVTEEFDEPDLPGVQVEAEVQPDDLVEAVHANGAEGQPQEED